jgi:uncharacterized protein YndB with AHSA1/START domain
MTQTTLTKAPTVHFGMRIRRPPEDVFEALAEPATTLEHDITLRAVLDAHPPNVPEL